MDQLQVQTVSCRGGLDTSRDVLSQGQEQPGSAVRLINYEPSLNGGYRRISGFTNSYGTVPGTGKVLGVCVANGVNDGIPKLSKVFTLRKNRSHTNNCNRRFL